VNKSGFTGQPKTLFGHIIWNYWLPKLRRNQECDAAAQAALCENGWRVLVIWDCETKDTAILAARLETLLKETAA